MNQSQTAKTASTTADQHVLLKHSKQESVKSTGSQQKRSNKDKKKDYHIPPRDMEVKFKRYMIILSRYHNEFLLLILCFLVALIVFFILLPFGVIISIISPLIITTIFLLFFVFRVSFVLRDRKGNDKFFKDLTKDKFILPVPIILYKMNVRPKRIEWAGGFRIPVDTFDTIIFLSDILKVSRTTAVQPLIRIHTFENKTVRAKEEYFSRKSFDYTLVCFEFDDSINKNLRYSFILMNIADYTIPFLLIPKLTEEQLEQDNLIKIPRFGIRSFPPYLPGLNFKLDKLEGQKVYCNPFMTLSYYNSRRVKDSENICNILEIDGSNSILLDLFSSIEELKIQNEWDFFQSFFKIFIEKFIISENYLASVEMINIFLHSIEKISYTLETLPIDDLIVLKKYLFEIRSLLSKNIDVILGFRDFLKITKRYPEINNIVNHFKDINNYIKDILNFKSGYSRSGLVQYVPPVPSYQFIIMILSRLAKSIEMTGLFRFKEKLTKYHMKSLEKDIRDMIIILLNLYFNGNATAETYNFGGKTDILVRANFKNIFIAECKIWKGKRSFELGDSGQGGVIDQLLNYLTSKDKDAAIILFITQNDLGAIKQQLPPLFQVHELFISELEFGNSYLKNDNDLLYFQFRHPRDSSSKLNFSFDTDTYSICALTYTGSALRAPSDRCGPSGWSLERNPVVRSLELNPVVPTVILTARYQVPGGEFL